MCACRKIHTFAASHQQVKFNLNLTLLQQCRQRILFLVNRIIDLLGLQRLHLKKATKEMACVVCLRQNVPISPVSSRIGANQSFADMLIEIASFDVSKSTKFN